MSRYTFKRATTPEELAEIHRLNHRIFVDEIGQHEPSGTGSLIDQFDGKNTYFIAKLEDRLVGMISVHDRPPFSVAAKLSDTDVLSKLGPYLLEVRLLAVHPDERNSSVFAGLLYAVLTFACCGDHSHLIISGVQKHLPMYERLGFHAIGPAVKRGKAEFTPMAVSVNDLPPQTVDRFRRRVVGSRHVCLLPGPVQPSRSVQQAFAEPPVSHRGEAFCAEFEAVRAQLERLSGGMRAALFPGSGTFANDVVGAAISADPSRHAGLILANGEFGCRLICHANRWRLPYRALSFDWASSWDLKAVVRCLDDHSEIDWIWAVQLETSTGILNDISPLRRLAEARGVELYLDCVSSFCAIEPDLRSVSIASAVSGKSIGSYSGAAIVLVRDSVVERLPSEAFPVALDLPAALRATGPLTTFPSQVIRALGQALTEQGCEKWEQYRALGGFVRRKLEGIGLKAIVTGPQAAPVITSFEPLPGDSPGEVVRRCCEAGFSIASESDYLRQRGWLQIATMGDIAREDLVPLFPALRP